MYNRSTGNPRSAPELTLQSSAQLAEGCPNRVGDLGDYASQARSADALGAGCAAVRGFSTKPSLSACQSPALASRVGPRPK